MSSRDVNKWTAIHYAAFSNSQAGEENRPSTCQSLLKIMQLAFVAAHAYAYVFSIVIIVSIFTITPPFSLLFLQCSTLSARGMQILMQLIMKVTRL